MQVLRRLIPYAKPYRGSIVVGLISLVVLDAAQLAIPILIGHAVDAIRMDDLHVVWVALSWIVVMVLIVSGLRYLWRTRLQGAAHRIERDVRNDFFAKLLRLPQIHLDRQRTGDLLSLSTNDLSAIRQFLRFGLMILCDIVVLIGFSVFMMLTMDAKLTLIILLPFAVLVPVTVLASRNLHQSHQAVQAGFGKLSARIQEDLYGIRILRASGQEVNRHRQFMKEADQYRKDNMSVVRLQGIYYPTLRFLTGLSLLILLWVGSKEVVLDRITLGQFVAFAEYVGILSWPLFALGWINNLIQRASAAMRRLAKVFDEEDEAHGDPESLDGQTYSRIEVQSLSETISGMAEDQGQFQLRNISMEIRKGEIVGLVGKVRCGKSSLITRILRIYDPPRGTIYLDGTDILDIPLTYVRRRISYMPQEGFLFSRSIAKNLTLGNVNASRDELHSMLDVVQLTEEINGFPQQIDTDLGERGITLSGGQRQRVALGRTLLKQADFYILDDPFFGVDLETEERIFFELRSCLNQKGILLITDRLRSLVHASRIYVMDQGQILDAGTHEKLLARCELYRKLVITSQTEVELMEKIL